MREKVRALQLRLLINKLNTKCQHKCHKVRTKVQLNDRDLYAQILISYKSPVKCEKFGMLVLTNYCSTPKP